MNCRWFTFPAITEESVSVCADDMVSSEVCANTEVAPGVQTPAFVHGSTHSFTVTCSPAVPFVVRALATEAAVPKVTVFPSSVPVLVRSMYRFTVSPGASAVIAVTKPPVIPTTDEGAWVSFRVPLVIEPPEVFDAVAVSAAYTDDEIRPTAPSAAVVMTRPFVA